ncbi:MAG: hypothetical protein CMG06_01450 [Candidatus Marinimicrobia bacterium]|nr:hypothetical protein [Candidatus Neomarinimicrobiota bacterium]|tara:strand:+ start:2126 stop:3100 length:975 start_codon:yes stop_codon:yes gene_type:complete
MVAEGNQGTIKMMRESKMIFDTIIVGAGMSGSYLSFVLKNTTKNILIIDKSRGVGGRMSTKPIGEDIVDYGCQYIKPKTDECSALTKSLEELGLVNEIEIKKGEKVYISPFGMNKIPQYLSRGVSVVTNEKVEKINYQNKLWEIDTGSISLTSRTLVLTMPLPQVEELMVRCNIKIDQLPNVEYSSFYTSTFVSNVHHLEEIIGSDDTFSWICNNKKKGLRNLNNVFTVNTSKIITRRLIEKEDPERKGFIAGKINEAGFNSIVKLNIHFWKYAFSSNQNNIDYIFNSDTGLGICGDSFSVGRVDGAVRSAELLSRELIRFLCS